MPNLPPLDPGLFDPNDAEASWTLPANWYYDPAIYQQEHEAIFYKSWWYQCHVTDIANPRDYYCGQVMDQEIFLIRGEDGRIRAFYNVCSHRAHPLLGGCGTSKKAIVCPYHQWCYDSAGHFKSARGHQVLADWIPANADLKPIQVENYGGFLFVNLDPTAAPLHKQAPKFLQDMYRACPQLDQFVRVKRIERSIAANWKTVIDNNHECYHCAVNHKSFMQLVDYENEADWSEDGITFTHTVKHKKVDNKAYVLDQLTQDSLFGYIWPNLIPLWFPGSPSAVLFQVIPTGPESAVARHDFYLTHLEPTAQEQEFIDWIDQVLVPEDQVLCERVQKGLHSRGYRQGKFVVNRDHVDFSEHHVHFFQRFVYRALMDVS
ncbi:MAG: aromatic ring-hydroxylating dioxygenase subunit alpha [Chloroflexota bacterium]